MFDQSQSWRSSRGRYWMTSLKGFLDDSLSLRSLSERVRAEVLLIPDC